MQILFADIFILITADNIIGHGQPGYFRQDRLLVCYLHPILQQIQYVTSLGCGILRKTAKSVHHHIAYLRIGLLLCRQIRYHPGKYRIIRDIILCAGGCIIFNDRLVIRISRSTIEHCSCPEILIVVRGFFEPGRILHRPVSSL